MNNDTVSIESTRNVCQTKLDFAQAIRKGDLKNLDAEKADLQDTIGRE
jgi:hypothetical protein